MIVQVIICIILVGLALGLGLKGGIDWQKDRGKSWGESHMKDFGFYEDNKDKE